MSVRQASQTPLLGRLEKHEAVSELLDAITKVQRIDCAKLRREIMSLHKRRPSSKLHLKGRLSPSKIQRASAYDQSVRSRVVAIKLMALRYTSLVNTLATGTVDILLFAHYEKIPRNSKTDKKAFIQEFVDQKMRPIYELEALIEACDFITEDIDKASWSLRLIMTGYELASRPEVMM